MADRIVLEAAILSKEIDNLVTAFPDLAEDEALRADMIEGSTDFAEVMARILDHEREAKSMVAAMDMRFDDLNERKSRWKRRQEAMRSLMLNLMSAADQQKVTLPEATISITKGRETVEVTDVEALPQGYFKTVRQADKVAILGALSKGESLPGASLRNGDASLTIRAK